MTTSTTTRGPMTSGAARPARRAALVCAAVLAALALPAAAERADRDKPTLIEANQCVTEELKQISVCTGNVLLTRGTLRISGERMELKQDPEGYRQASVDAAPGQLAQRRSRTGLYAHLRAHVGYGGGHRRPRTVV